MDLPVQSPALRDKSAGGGKEKDFVQGVFNLPLETCLFLIKAFKLVPVVLQHKNKTILGFPKVRQLPQVPQDRNFGSQSYAVSALYPIPVLGGQQSSLLLGQQ